MSLYFIQSQNLILTQKVAMRISLLPVYPEKIGVNFDLAVNFSEYCRQSSSETMRRTAELKEMPGTN